MILKSIELNNFMCYAGTNRFDFTEGINVIIGDNGYGKSKLYDAFYWVMYNRCFDTSLKKFAETSSLKRLIVSDKAIKEQEDGNITASVILTFHNTEKDSVYILERRYTINKSGETIKEDQDSEEIIWFKELSFLNAREIKDRDEIKRIKNNILPDNIKPYMWFQGEQVESIIDFNKSDTLTQAINVLSNITRFDNIIAIAENLKESSSKEYNKKQRDLSSNKGESEQLELKRQELIRQIKALELQDIQIRDNLAIAEEKSEFLLNKFADAKSIQDIEAKRLSIEKNLNDVQDEFHEEQKNLHKRMFTNKWVLKGTENLFEEYSKIYSSFEQVKLQNEANIKAKLDSENALLIELQARLPIDVPEPIHLEHMLGIERCLVCDREAPKDSVPWLKMKELMDRSKMKIKTLEDEEKSVHNFSGDLKKLYQNGLGLSHNIKNIDDDISSTFRRLRKLDKKRKALSEDLLKIESEKNSLIVDAALNVSQANNLLNEYSAQNELVRRSSNEIISNSNIISRKKEELLTIEAQLSKLVVGEIPAYLLDKVRVLDEFYQVAHSTRKRVFNKLVKVLEEEANKHYLEMTQDNMSSRGVIRLRELSNGKNYMPELVDENGNVLLQLNTGNIILIKLATIMAIISARQGSRDTDLYTLITDAPMSVFGEDYTIGFCKTVSKVYRQSIIMSKEFYKNIKLREQLLTDSEIKLGKVYLITPSITENTRSNRNSLSTNIEKLN
ncbi:SMC domain protein [Emticicia oligotrophica DSM 17448]|uniref:SMC domain protein n=2 Tax=Emticicia TaxID=312278 RepID=A0ABN4AP62_EMTOG|nr:SMC domain protein [Emticicia oligotrophica DSM 17448]